MTEESRIEHANPLEINAIAGTILKLVGEHVSCSDEVLIAALKISASTIEETKTAWFGAQMRAGMLRQYGGGKR
jgi:hypothetical protein